ncbi:hypothetical protein ACKWTF_014542 [Chironomus riparius]
MKFLIIILFIVKISEIICESVDPIDTEYYQNVVLNKTLKQDIEATRNGRIVGGSPAVLGQFDYFVIVYGENRRYLCGGTLIKADWVLTAGHCLYGFKNVEIHFGIINRLASPERSLKIEDNSHLIVHENFDSKELWNDIALIYLEKMSISWLESSSIGFIEPTPLVGDLTNQIATICGFGKTSDASGASYNLNYIKIPVMEYEKCEAYYYLDENNICVSTKTGESPCNGDSGGGVVITTEDDQKFLIGIVSFGTSLCEIKYPVVLTKLSNYIDWMDEKFEYFKNPTTTTATTATTTTTTKASSTTPTTGTFEDDTTTAATTTISTKSISSTTPNSGVAKFSRTQVAFVIVTILISIGM